MSGRTIGVSTLANDRAIQRRVNRHASRAGGDDHHGLVKAQGHETKNARQRCGQPGDSNTRVTKLKYSVGEIVA